MPRVGSPIFSVSPSLGDEEFALAVSPAKSTPPVNWLHVYPAHGVIVCTHHRTGYTAKNIAEHVSHVHLVKTVVKKAIIAWVRQSHLRADVVNPLSHGPPIPSLQVISGWQCTVVSCSFLTASMQVMSRHCSGQHGLRSKRQCQERGAISEVSLQKWFAKSGDYFVVNPSLASSASSSTHVVPSWPSSFIPSSPVHGGQPSGSICRRDNVLLRTQQAIHDEEATRLRRIEEPQHRAELSSWNRLSKYHEHLTGIETELIPLSYQVPLAEDEDAVLYHASQSVQRVFRQVYGRVASLHHVDARRLNSFQVNTVRQDPFSRLQEQASDERYVHQFCRLVCYFHRVTEGHHFEPDMFEVTESQSDACQQMCEAIERRIEEGRNTKIREKEGKI